MRKITVIVALTLLMLAVSPLLWHPAASAPVTSPIQVFNVGDTLRTGSYCANEVEAKKLAVAVALDGDTGYVRVMRDRSVGCFDYRFNNNARVLTVTLVSKAFQVDMPDGQRFQFWVVRNAAGVEGYAWTYLGGGSTIKLTSHRV